MMLNKRAQCILTLGSTLLLVVAIYDNNLFIVCLAFMNFMIALGNYAMEKKIAELKLRFNIIKKLIEEKEKTVT